MCGLARDSVVVSSAMRPVVDRIRAKKAKLDALRPIASAALAHLQKYYDVELTYTSNAIEGNTLTLRETAEVIEHGITVGGKRLREHLEAVDHYAAVLWMRDIAAGAVPIDEGVVLELHRRIVARSDPAIAGVYSQHRRRIAGSSVVFPNPLTIPELMEEMGRWLRDAPPTPQTAWAAHFRLTAIHPFSDGNGRTARLLMNLLLVRGGYVPIAVRPKDRNTYLEALEEGSTTGDVARFDAFLFERLDATLTDYLEAVSEGREAGPSHKAVDG